MAAGQGKGSLLIHTHSYVDQKFGPGVWTELVEGASDADRKILSGVVLRGGWYPIGTINRLVDRVCYDHGAPNPEEEMRRLSAYIADSDLGTVYKLILKMGSPELLVKRTGSLWRRYFDTGDMRATELGEHHWELELRMATGNDAAPNALFCGPGCPAWIEMGMRLTGAEHARVQHIDCRHTNGDHCTYDVTW
jgi:hypothetical protein